MREVAVKRSGRQGHPPSACVGRNCERSAGAAVLVHYSGLEQLGSTRQTRQHKRSHRLQERRGESCEGHRYLAEAEGSLKKSFQKLSLCSCSREVKGVDTRQP